MPSAPLHSRLATWILCSAGLGLAAGVVVGERAAILQPFGLAYSKMLAIAVFPYLICSLLVGLGGLAREHAARLLRASWPTFLMLWAATFATIFLLAAVIPRPPLPDLLKPDAAGSAATLIDLLIPADLAQALHESYTPAIVIFAILYGVAIQSNPRKASVLEAVEVLRKTSVTIWTWVVYVAPLGVFALFASTAGTVDADAAGSLLSYMALHLIGTFGLAFVVLPLALRSLVGLRYGEVLAELRPAITLALVTTLPAAALPQIQRAAERLLATRGIEGAEANDVVRASLSVGYVLCQLGNGFVALFVLFLSYEDRVDLSAVQTALLPFMTLLAGIGSPGASVDAVAFLADWLRLPPGATDLYMEAMTVTRYGQAAASVMGFAFVTLAVPMIHFGRARRGLRPLAVAALAGVALFGTTVAAGRVAAPTLFPPPSDAVILSRTLSPATMEGVDMTYVARRPTDLAPLDGAGSLDAIRSRGRIRIGYGPGIVPFSYANETGELVGYDVAAAYRLARGLHVAIEFVPVSWPTVEEDLNAGRYDIVMAGAYATAERLRRLEVSAFHMTSPAALIVRAENAHAFLDYEEIAAREGLRLAVLHDPALEPLVRHLFPNAAVTVLGSAEELPRAPAIDAALWTADQAAAWTRTRSDHTAVVPRNIGSPLPFAYLMPKGAEDLRRHVDLWLALEAAQGIREQELDYWLRGKPGLRQTRRWNAIDDLLLPWLDPDAGPPRL